MKSETYLIGINLREASAWKFCPKCGSELLEVYPGDFVGHTTCMNESDDDCIVDFDVIHIKDGEAWCGRHKYGAGNNYRT